MNKIVTDNWQCPHCHAIKLTLSQEKPGDQEIICLECDNNFPIVDGIPVLIRNDNQLFPPSSYQKSKTKRKTRLKISKLIPDPSVNLSRKKNSKAFIDNIETDGTSQVLVIGSGQQKGTNSFYSDKKTTYVYCDVAMKSEVDLFCDAHELPFVDKTFQGVIITAVLEHVLYPQDVVKEIYRVLSDEGIIYSEVPFMQHVHEGAYDFTRYTLSGHRLLFKRFNEVSSGLVAGPATGLVWAMEHFALCFVSGGVLRKLTRALVRVLFFWVKYFDYLFINNPQSIDSASATYFLGKKSHLFEASDKMIVNAYKGAQNHNIISN
jgi:uncharacterized protein YbaR (Trm112 family)/SAM-dependent methyltransferase